MASAAARYYWSRPPSLPQLWEATLDGLTSETVLVLGADRPLGTVLRANPELNVRFAVLHAEAERYKTDEVRHDPRVELVSVTHAELENVRGAGIQATIASGPDHSERIVTGACAYLNLGSKPVALTGHVATDELGYCPPAIQHQRILVAGDLRSSRYQRIMAAIGSGSEAALRVYYQRNGLF